MKEIMRTNDTVLVTAVEALLKGADIPHMVLDQNMSVLDGSLGMLPRRIVVDGDYLVRARRHGFRLRRCAQSEPILGAPDRRTQSSLPTIHS